MTATLDAPGSTPTGAGTSLDKATAELERLLKLVPTETPTGAVPWPMVLVEGEEKAGKSWLLAEFTGSEKVGRAFWLEFGFEGTAQQYGAVPGANYQVVNFTNLADFMERLAWLRHVGKAALAAGEKPILVCIDSMSGEWKALGALAKWRARQSKKNRAILRQDPNAEINAGPNYWNPVIDKHYEILNLLAAIPGIVVYTARGRDVSAIGDDGNPTGEKVWSTQAQKDLSFDSTAILRVRRGTRGRRAKVEVVGCRSVFAGIQSEDEAVEPPKDRNPLEWLIFDYMKCDPVKAYSREVRRDGADEDRAEESRRLAERDARAQGDGRPPQNRQQAQQRPQRPPAAPAQASADTQGKPVTEMTGEQLLVAIKAGLEYLEVRDLENQIRVLADVVKHPVENPNLLTMEDRRLILTTLREYSALEKDQRQEIIAAAIEQAIQDEASAEDDAS
ncbi:hypothetical protein DMC64_41440 [Amycolatopsis sp. WAC 04197]|uniref:hypothetical protein n=1 Tax=Amycolatopsis sp. WAC 04197 TaxID=2203199 RepID=UPI000F7AB2E2|nr:hypothetical protein [Amycolatopsis sp. WAC 04197]RSN38534.1 hypothetical protein DMC64_41440 [Amycolatopsis sp. WAC 04197]